MRYKLFDVFTDRPCSGSSTAVVYWDGPADRPRMHEVARELCVRDTFFLLPASAPGVLFSSLTFTPSEELVLCGQGMVAGVHAVLDDGPLPSGAHQIETAVGVRSARVEPGNGARPVVFVGLGRPEVHEEDLPPAAELLGDLGLDADGPARAATVALGRTRLLLEVPHAVLGAREPSPSRVLAVCARLETTGVILFAMEGSALARVRHFTRSLRGEEDPVTGGAAGALLALLRARRPGEPPRELTLHQGEFAGRRGGWLLARWDEAQDGPEVGGTAVKIAEGRLLF